MKPLQAPEEALRLEVEDLRRQLAELRSAETRHLRQVEAWRDLWAQFEAMVEAFDGLLYICSATYEVEFMNQRFIQRTGHYPLGQKCYQALHNRDDICPWCVNERVFRGETVRWEVQSPKDNRWYYVVNTPIRHPDGAVSKMAMIQDITERKQAEDSLRRASRALKTLSACDYALVRATDEAGFLQEICRIMVELGGYRLAWVGLALEDEAKTVQPVAQAGFEQGYLETLHITWADTEQGRGPTGAAIRTGQTCIVTDMAADPHFGPWREEFLSRGYASSLALPLKVHGQVLGALTIYAGEAEAFDPEEVRLLENLAEETAFGITSLRQQAAHRRMEQALRTAEAKYRGIFEHAVEGIFQSTPEGRFLDVNPAMARMCGYDSPEDMVAAVRHIGQQLHVNPQVREEFTRRLAEAGDVLGFECELYRRDRSTIWVSASARAVRDEDGAVLYYEGFIQDISHRRSGRAAE
jgi:PAS domain S-box-containing protein